MLALALKFWKPLAGLVGIVVLALALFGLKHSYDEGKRDEGRNEVRTKELKPLQAAVKAAQERASALALQWDQQRQAAESAGKERDDERAKRFAEAAKRAQALPVAVAAAPVDARAVSLLNDAIASQQPAPAGATGQPEQAAAAIAQSADSQQAMRADADGRGGLHDGGSTVGLLSGWALEAIRLYDECRATVSGWQDFYAGLRAAQPK